MADDETTWLYRALLLTLPIFAFLAEEYHRDRYRVPRVVDRMLRTFGRNSSEPLEKRLELVVATLAATPSFTKQNLAIKTFVEEVSDPEISAKELRRLYARFDQERQACYCGEEAIRLSIRARLESGERSRAEVWQHIQKHYHQHNCADSLNIDQLECILLEEMTRADSK